MKHITTFKNEAMQRLYEVMREAAASRTSPIYHANGEPITLTGNSHAYWRGRDGHPARYLRTSLAYAAWAAGRDDRRAAG